MNVASTGSAVLAEAAAIARGRAATAAELQEIWDGLEALLPCLEAAPAGDAAIADILCHLLQHQLGARLPVSARYSAVMAPLAAELHTLLGEATTADRGPRWFAFVTAAAAAYTTPDLPLRHRLLAWQWAKMACGKAFAESGAILVPPLLTAADARPHWLAAPLG